MVTTKRITRESRRQLYQQFDVAFALMSVIPLLTKMSPAIVIVPFSHVVLLVMVQVPVNV